MKPRNKDRITWIKTQRNDKKLFLKWKAKFPTFSRSAFLKDRIEVFGTKISYSKVISEKNNRIEWMKTQKNDSKLSMKYMLKFPKVSHRLFYYERTDVFGISKQAKTKRKNKKIEKLQKKKLKG